MDVLYSTTESKRISVIANRKNMHSHPLIIDIEYIFTSSVVVALYKPCYNFIISNSTVSGAKTVRKKINALPSDDTLQEISQKYGCDSNNDHTILWMKEFSEKIRKYSIDDFVNSDEPYQLYVDEVQSGDGIPSYGAALLLQEAIEKTKDESIIQQVSDKIQTYQYMLYNTDDEKSIIFHVL